MQVTQVSGTIRRLWRADAQKMNITEIRRVGIGGGECQSAGIQILSQQRFQTVLEERCLTAGGPGDPVGADVEPHHLMTHVSQAGGVRQAQIANADDCQSHAWRWQAHEPPMNPSTSNSGEYELAPL